MLAERAAVNLSDIYTIEEARRLPPRQRENLASAQNILEAAGIEFTGDDYAPGVRLKTRREVRTSFFARD
jgi:hypothetical protein